MTKAARHEQGPSRIAAAPALGRRSKGANTSHDGDADWTLLRYRMRRAEGGRDSRRRDDSQHSAWLARVGVVSCSAASTPTDAKARHSAMRRRAAIGASPPARRSKARKLGKWMTLPLTLDPIG
ncbi:predicted protein [Verticillium alfalfae VaMs.102]|uniref:Predicted protein n=1 Tax=Verticillium alfalfae (strain VaMs.102 / ATCC MYA-4576 / FGSC 10136) TaxID=526221 RepID=C9S853_VERA1|nr:predicted protein [Verticillium alfalfae VaMs.102]EEY14899.1 predicted protein [Verticillium alfalfae VaMs.102]